MSAEPKVAIHDGEITIDTYPYDQQDRFPDVFMKGRRWGMVYPYPLLNHQSEKKVPRKYRAVFIENEYLRVTMVPDLGGHLYAARDKLNNREVFYRNSCIKPSQLGQRGAWVPMGIEFNFPTAHSPVTLSPVHYAMRRNADGSATAIVGDIDRMTRMRWSVEITLRPGRTWVEAHVTLDNRTPLQQWYYWWSNAAIHVGDGTKYVYPVAFTAGHGATHGRNRWPIIRGLDYSWHKNVRATFGMFGRGSRHDFMGAYDVDHDWGMAHVADYRVLPGKKLFDWGVTRAGQKWIREFSLADGPYSEVQAGLFEEQPAAGPLEPHGVIRFREIWVPLHGLGAPFSYANDEAAVALDASGEKIHVGLNVSAARPKSRVVLSLKGKALFERTVDISPEKPFATDIEKPKSAFADHDLRLDVIASDGAPLLSYRPEPPVDEKTPSDGWLDRKRHADESGEDDNGTAERVYLRGLTWESMRIRWRARKLYEEALNLDPGFARARLRLGFMCAASGQWDEAIRHLSRALARDASLSDAHYYLGLAHAGKGDDEAARDAFWSPLRLNPEDARCLNELALIALRQGRLVEAEEFLRRVLRINPNDARAAGTLSIALRAAGRAAEALEVVAPALDLFGTDYLLRSESARLHELLGSKREAEAERTELRRLLDRVDEAYIELALDYLAAGRFDETLEILEAGIAETGTRTGANPMLHYHAGGVLERLGRDREARSHYRRAAKMKPDYCFPSRSEAFAALERAIELNPGDARARMYLGNLLYARERRAEAVMQWRAAAQTIKDSVVLFRSLAYAAWEREDLKRAIHWLRRALRLEPKNERLLMPLLHIMLEDRRSDAVLRLLTRAYRENPESDAVREQYAAMLIDQGHPDKAADLLANHRFRSRHGIFSLTRLHLNAHIALGEKEMEKGDMEKAFGWFDIARHIPVHLGEDELMVKFFGKAHYLAGMCLEKLGRKAEAKTCYRQCLNEADRGLPELQLYKYLAHTKLGHESAAKKSLARLDAAISHLKKHNNTQPAYLHYLRALLLEGQGQKARAKHEKALAYRNGWRDSMAHDFAYKFGFS